MTPVPGLLARRIADALIRLLPTADWSSGLADEVARILGGGDPTQQAAVSSLLRASRDRLRQVIPGQRDQAEDQLYKQWARRLEAILKEDPFPGERADLVLSALHRAAAGFGSGWHDPGGSLSPSGHGRPEAEAAPVGRYLRGRCAEVILPGRPFSLIADITQSGVGPATRLLPFDAPAEGLDVLLVVYAPGLRVLGDHRLTVRVPAAGNSSPVMFELRADAEGPQSISLTAWLGGNYLGELPIGVTAARDTTPADPREFLIGVDPEPGGSPVSLLVRYEPELRAYRFAFIDEDCPDEVPSRLSYEPRQEVERLVADLDQLAAGHGGYSPDQTRDYLANAGAELWRKLLPPELREQFWDRQHRIGQLTIRAKQDIVPWELLYPKDPGHDKGFLVQQFPVTRGIFGRHRVPSLSLRPARFVLPQGSLPQAEAEIDAMRRLLDPAQAPDHVIADLTPLLDLIRSGGFSLLHFACHNRFVPEADASIRMGRAQFTPRFLTMAGIDKSLERMAPIVFMNACRSAGLRPTYNGLDGWASKFLEAGAGAFIGSLWAVSDDAAREFAEEFYEQLKGSATLGQAVTAARKKTAARSDDPTWLAYTAYGDPRARIASA